MYKPIGLLLGLVKMHVNTPKAKPCAWLSKDIAIWWHMIFVFDKFIGKPVRYSFEDPAGRCLIIQLKAQSIFDK